MIPWIIDFSSVGYIYNDLKWLHKKLSLQDRLWFRSLIELKTPIAPMHGEFYHPWSKNNLYLRTSPLGYNNSFNETFSDICDSVASEIISNVIDQDKMLLLEWSGGVDSTIQLVAFLKNNIPLSKFGLLISNDSISENSDFYHKFIYNKIQCFNIKTHNLHKNQWLVTGRSGDSVFGENSTRRRFFRSFQLTGLEVWEKEISTLQQHLFLDYQAGEWFIHQLVENLKNAPVKITTIGGLLCWLEYNFISTYTDVIVEKYFGSLLGQVNNDKLYAKNMNQYIQVFYRHNLFQQYLLKQIETTGSPYYHNLKDFKKEGKRYIFEYDKNSNYINYKDKVKSGAIVEPSRSSYPFMIDTEDNAYYKPNDIKVLKKSIADLVYK